MPVGALSSSGVHSIAGDMAEALAMVARGGPAADPGVLRIAPRLVDKIELVVQPSDRPQVITFERYADADLADLAASGDPDALVLPRPNGQALVIRKSGGLNLVGGPAYPGGTGPA